MTRTIKITVPVDPTGTGYPMHHVDTQLDQPLAETMRAIVDACNARSVRLRNGRVVATGPDVVRHLLELVGDGMGETADAS